MTDEDESSGDEAQAPTANLQRLSREPMRFELLNAFREYSENAKLSVTDPATEQSFFEAAREALQRELKKPSTLFGISAQAMFASMVASLGKVRLIKEEDQGGAYSLDNRRVPDFFIALEDGRRLLVEVKSHYQERGNEVFTLRSAEAPT